MNLFRIIFALLYPMNLLIPIVITMSMVLCCSCGEPQNPGLFLAGPMNNKAVAQMGQFDFEAASSTLQDLINAYPNSTELQINFAISLLNRQNSGDEKRALAILQDILQNHPHNLRARYCSALLLLHSGMLEEALNAFFMVSSVLPDDAETLYFIGQTLMQMSRYEEAVDYFNRSINNDQYISSNYYNLIICLRHLGRNDDAMKMIGLFKEIKDNPRVRVVEFKYSKMGNLAMATALDVEKTVRTLPSGPLFQPKTDIVLLNAPSSLFAEITASSEISIADINGDGHSDLFLPGLPRALLKNLVLLGEAGSFRYTLDAAHPLARIDKINSVLWGDINDDGLLDAYILRKGINQLWLQKTAGNWVNTTTMSKTGGAELNSIAGTLFDADHDGDLDIFVINNDGANELFNNNRDGSFRTLAEEKHIEGYPPSVAVVVQDLDNDRDADIIVINAAPPHQVHLNDKLWNYRGSVEYNQFIHHDIVALTAGDLDSNGEIELYSLGSSGGLLSWQRDSRKNWQPRHIFTLENDLNHANSKIGLADCNGDGSLEIIAVTHGIYRVIAQDGNDFKMTDLGGAENHASATLLSTLHGPAMLVKAPGGPLEIFQPGPARFDFALIEVFGRKEKEANLRTNSSGIGTTLAVRAGSQWTIIDTFSNDFNCGQNHQPLAIGLGGEAQIDFVQLNWPDGVFQTEMALSPGTLHQLIEKQRQMSSCPVLFAWDGKKFEFVSDLLGVGGIGYAIGPGVYAQSRPWEYFLLPDKLSVTRNGRIHLKMTEPMEEVEYLDHVSLTSYDLPPSWSMTMDERMGILDPQPTGSPVFFRKSLFPALAVNDRGENVTQTIAQADLKAAPVGRLDRRFIGMLVDFHTLTLTFDTPLDTFKGDPVLVADGWVEYPYSQTSFAAWQAGAQYYAPSLEVRTEEGEWQPLLEQFGYPAGMPRQMSVPLQGLPPGVKAIRISTNQEIYWDRIFIAYAEPCPEVLVTQLKLKSAMLENIGFPLRVDYDQRRPYYDFSHRLMSWDTRLQEGNYSRLGDIFELVAARDSALAILGPGEGIDMQFAAPPSAPVAGWKRNFVLGSFGWCKDMDLFTDSGDTVVPLPGAPDEPIPQVLHRKYNTRFLAGRR